MPPSPEPRETGAHGATPRAPSYLNPSIPEGINVSPEHPLKEFATLVSGVVAMVVALVLVFGWLGSIVGALLPFETERRLAESVAQHFEGRGTDPRSRDYVQALADRIVDADPLPEGMAVTVHVIESEEVNAFATLGGHIAVYRGLLERMPHENALAMVLAHEIAHVRERHVVRSLGRGILIQLALALVTGATDGELANVLIGNAGATAGLSYSRSQEDEADRIALRGVHALYAHTGGALALFEVLEQGGFDVPEWLSTHPDNHSRIDTLRSEAARRGWPDDGPPTALPVWLGSRSLQPDSHPG